MSTVQIKRELLALADTEKAAFFPRFFKCGTGEYGEGDKFIGVTVPQVRAVAKRHSDASLSDVKALLGDPIHECRLLALVILVLQFADGDDAEQKRIVDFYVKNKKRVNNWDLVDSSAHQILGEYLVDRNRGILEEYAKSDHLWTQRIAIVATFAFIRRGELDDTFDIADMLLTHSHDLIHKAVGWMLREAGKRDEKALKRFLKTRYPRMPRTMLRYAIEKFPEQHRQRYLKGSI